MTERRLERVLAVVLIVGVGLSAALVGLGFVASFLVGWNGSLVGAAPIANSTTDFSDLLGRLIDVEPLAIAQAGLLLLVATPVFRVIVSAIGFAVEGDRLYVALSLAVVALLLVSLAVLR